MAQESNIAGSVLESEIVEVYERYIATFNAGDIDGCVANFAIPYFDLRSEGDKPVQVVYTSVAQSRGYFEDITAQMKAAGWSGSTKTVNTRAWPLSPDMAVLLVDFERLTGDGDLISAHRCFYTFTRAESEWKIAGYMMADPDYRGPGDIELPN